MLVCRIQNVKSRGLADFNAVIVRTYRSA